MGFQNKPQNINEKKKTQGKNSEMIEGSGIEIFITGLNGPSIKKADNHDNDDTNDDDDDDKLIQSSTSVVVCYDDNILPTTVDFRLPLPSR